MPITLGSNINSLMAQRKLANTTDGLARTYERLSSGMRINRASDDAAGLAVSSKLNSDARVYTQGIRNANDGISALSIAQGTLGEASNIVIRLRELATGAANGAFSAAQRRTSDTEAKSLTEEFNRLVMSVDFNGIKLLDGSLVSMAIQLGFGSNGLIGFGLGKELSRKVNNGFENGFDSGQGPLIVSDQSISADLNGDGYSDLIVNSESGGIAISLGSASGQMTALSGPAADVVSGFAIGDINGDGKLDLVASINNISTLAGGINVFLGNGDGTFGAGSVINSTRQYSDVGLGDIDGDGKLDIIASRTSGSSIDIALGNGNGTFGTSTNRATASNIGAVNVADFNNDGRADLLLSGAANSYLYSSAGGSSISLSQTFASTLRVRAIDYNRDGALDVVGISGSSYRTYTGNGNGTFGSATTVSLGAAYFSLKIGDIDGDGLEDLIFSQSASSSSLIYSSTGTGSFNFAQSVAGPWKSEIGDFNGDGVLDIAQLSVIFEGNNILLAKTKNSGSIARLDLTSKESARSALATLDAIFNRISRELGSIGAAQSRIGSAINTLTTASENFSAAAGRIRDADIAGESAELVRRQILQQASAAVLAQANQQPSLALQFLR